MLKRRSRILFVAALMLCSSTLSGCLIGAISFFHFVEVVGSGGGNIQARANLANCLAEHEPSLSGEYENVSVECAATLELWQSITRFVALGMPRTGNSFGRLFVDPVILQVPEAFEFVSGAYQDERETPSWGDIVIERTNSFSVTPTTEVHAEPGTVFYILDLPAAAFANLPTNPTIGPEFRFELGYEFISAATTLSIKAMLSARVDDGDKSYYLPTLPCTTDFASVPAINVALIDGEVQNLATVISALLSSSSDLVCDGQEYSFLPQNPDDCGNGIIDPSEDCDGGSCCTSTCTFELAAASCDDDDTCTLGDHCDGAGSCLSDALDIACTCGNASIDPGEECDGDTCCNEDCTLDQDSPACSNESEIVGNLENPSGGGTYGGILLLSGWVCDAEEVTLEVDGGKSEIKTAYPTRRDDTIAACGKSETGFGATWNYNLFGPGRHQIVAKADGVPFAESSFVVRAPGTELANASAANPGEVGGIDLPESGSTTLLIPFLRGASGTYNLPDFPRAGKSSTIRWSEGLQNFVLVDLEQEFVLETLESKGPTTGVGVLENPQKGGSASGISLLSGWFCDAEKISLVIDGVPQTAGYGTERGDTEEICGDSDNGFGLTWNYGLLGPGVHRVEAYADGELFGAASFFVATPGTRFLSYAPKSYILKDFPGPGLTTPIGWQKATQSFVVVNHPEPFEEQNFLQVQPAALD
ncbi:MAG: hypothetical protein P8R42_11445 [Candidatus Binatia bacterium]|nr:hypothetical protein [Candidatus Binatia bacterium]